MSIYLLCIYFLMGMLAILAVFWVLIAVMSRDRNGKQILINLKQKRTTLYLKYDLKTKEVSINSQYNHLSLDIGKYLAKMFEQKDFIKNIRKNSKESNVYMCEEKFDDKIFYFNFSFREDNEEFVILRCDYTVEKIVEPVVLKSIDDIKKIHSESENKNAVLSYMNIKDFNSVNQRYGQRCGDYVLEVIKTRFSKLERNKLQCCYLGADQFAVYYNSKRVNKKRAMNLMKQINRKLTRPVDVGYMNLNMIFGSGVCVGEYESLDQFIKCAYVAADYAKKRKHYNIVMYNDMMKLEDEVVNNCEKELEWILSNKEININYNPVFYHVKSKFVGYISNPVFSVPSIKYSALKNFANQRELGDELVSAVIDNQLINYLKKRPKKSSKLFINLSLEELPVFLETYLSNSAYGDCKIVVCLNVKKGYEMINKFSSISSTISKMIEEGIEFALEINYSNMYNYDYILKNANYLILDDSIVSNMNNTLVKNRFLNILELARIYELELFAVDVKEYIQFENLLKYDVHYFSGSYFGKGAKKPNEIEQSKTKIFAKFIKDSKKNKKFK